MREGSRYSPGVEPASGSVIGWRIERLVAAGFGRPLATSLARDWAVDLHALLELVDRGCAPELAARILAPLEEERQPC
jgi:hypothetical protein